MFIKELLNSEFVILFLIIIFGIILGKLKYKGFSLDISAVIFIALLFGHLGYKVPESVQTLGLVLYIFTIGMQSGPGFVDAFLKYGRKYLLLCLVLISTAFLMTYVLGKIWDLNSILLVGVFNGALTSTPGLAAAIEATGSNTAALGYGLSYPAGVILVILFLQIIPKLLKINFKTEELNYEQSVKNEFPEIIVQHIKITNENINGKTIKELDLRRIFGIVVSRVKHQNEVFTPTANTVLYVGDILKITGSSESIDKSINYLGSIDENQIVFDSKYEVSWVLLTNRKIIGKTLSNLNITNIYGATVTRVKRSNVDLRPTPNLSLRFGDKLLIAAPSEKIIQVNQLFGNDNKKLSETNFLPIALGILIGIIVGTISLSVFGTINFSLGITGGVLLSSIFLSNIGKTGPIIWAIPENSINLIKKLGLLLFLSAIGTKAGSNMAEMLSQFGYMPIIAGILITLVPMIVATFFGFYILKINFLTLIGVIAGGMTSTPGLAIVSNKSSSDAAIIAYATVYPMALVLMILFSQILCILI